MDLRNEILNIYNQIKSFKPNKNNSLPENTYFLNDELILCMDRKYGDSRYPYSVDGFTLWAHASGNIAVNESNYFLFPPTLEGKQPSLTFFGGVKKGDNYSFISINGNCDHFLNHKISKYTVYSRCCCYFLREFENVLFAVKIFVSDKKRIYISLFANNLDSDAKEIYLASYMNPLMIRGTTDDEESKWFKTIELTPFGAHALTIEDVSRTKHNYNHTLIKRCATQDNIDIHSTTSREVFASGRHNHISLSEALLLGHFDQEKTITAFSDTAVFGDIVLTTLQDECFGVNYEISQAFTESDYEKLLKENFTLENLKSEYSIIVNDERLTRVNNLKVSFDKFNSLDLDSSLFNSFLKQVINQVDYCAKAKNSSLSLLGIRDAFQMIESSLLWDPLTAREKILQSLNFIDKTGRSPRQYSIPSEGTRPIMDNREFIDQGQWIITTIYQYLAFTNDYSLLNEKCKYFHIEGGSGYFYEEEGTVLEHLEKIILYLIKNIDQDTKCLCTLYGDWNDAVNGLGLSEIEGKQFGNGVSVMATFHLIKNLFEIDEIFTNVNHDIGIDFKALSNEVKEGVNKYAIQSKDGIYKIVHGWGEDRKFYVGSFQDVDGISRDSLTSNAFYVIAGLIKDYPHMKEHIINAYNRLDSKYGYLTFSHYFDKKDGYKVGRIINLPKGTAENAATYIHATLFAIRSLILMGETDKAFEQIYKVIPITHEKLTHSPFVMPNSYVFNKDIDVDGQSMNDWYTGSSNTLIKAIVFDLFGINPKIGNIIEITPSKFPCNKASITLNIKNKKFNITYSNNNNGQRTMTFNGKEFKQSININDCLDVNNIAILD